MTRSGRASCRSHQAQRRRRPVDLPAVHARVAKRDHAFPKDVKPTVFGMSNPLSTPAREVVEGGFHAISRAITAGSSATSNRRRPGQLPSCARPPPTPSDRGRHFREGSLTEGSSSNVFVVKNGVCGDEKNNLVLGHHYDVVSSSQGEQPAVEVRPISEAEVRADDEIWVPRRPRKSSRSRHSRENRRGANRVVFSRMHASTRI